MPRTTVTTRAGEVYYCTFDGTTTDSISNIAPTFNVDTSYVTGKFNGTQALSLNTSTGKFSIPTPSNFMAVGTFSCWLLQSSLPGGSSLFLYSSNTGSGANNNRVILGAGVGIKFDYTDAEGTAHTLNGSSPNFTAGVWQHVAVTWQPGEMKLYVGGVSNGSAPSNTIFNARNQANLWILNRNGGGQNNGAIANLIIYNRAISADGIARMAARTTPILVGEYFE